MPRLEEGRSNLDMDCNSWYLPAKAQTCRISDKESHPVELCKAWRLQDILDTAHKDNTVYMDGSMAYTDDKAYEGGKIPGRVPGHDRASRPDLVPGHGQVRFPVFVKVRSGG
jgi:hypothetical protein